MACIKNVVPKTSRHCKYCEDQNENACHSFEVLAQMQKNLACSIGFVGNPIPMKLQ